MEHLVIGIDLGGMSARAAVLKGEELLGCCSRKTSAASSPRETAKTLAALSKEVCERANVPFSAVEAVGIGSPGVIEGETGTVVLWSNFGWHEVPLASLFEEECGKRAFVTNDANAAALGEAKFGAGKKYSDSILITLGTGVGGGIVLGGKLFEGYRSAGAEIGHMVIRQNGELCTCGRRGCFERYASASAIIKNTRLAAAAHPDSLLNETPADKINGKTAFDAARAGDAAAKEVVAEYVAALGEGIANLAAILRPQAVLLGGGISREGEFLLAPLREYVYPRLYVSERRIPFEIVCAKLYGDAGLYGAAAYALSRL